MRARLGPRWRKQADVSGGLRPPLVHVHKHKSAMRIAAMDERARSLGLRIDQGLADARAQCPDLDIVPHVLDADHALLNALADWCDRYTPLVALDSNHGLFLDITGCAHLFSGEHAMVRDLLARLFEQGFAAQAGVADTAGAAHAAAWYGTDPARDPVHVASGAEAEVLRPFGLAALRLPSQTVDGLARVGIKTIGQLAEAARAPVARRFGRHCLQRLDQAFGELDEVLSPRLPVCALSAERRLAEPVMHADDIRQLLYKLASRLKLDMEERGVGGRVFEAALFRVDGIVKRLSVGTSQPLRDPARIDGLFAERITALGDDIDAGYGFDVVRLSVSEDAPLAQPQGDFSVPDDNHQDVTALMDRIAARLGDCTNGAPHPVKRMHRLNSHMPERAETHVPYDLKGEAKTRNPDAGLGAETPPRPLRFLPRPEPIDVVAEVPEGAPMRFVWRRTTCRVVRAEGPERIAGEWWNDCDDTDEQMMTRPRDYYRVEDDEGRRYWIFRSGLYEKRRVAADEDTARPRWFMQGFFA
ncbi:MAG: DNA polymerase Y family protein [Pseudomonadota bacterium]